MQKNIVLDLYIIDEEGMILVNSASDSSQFNSTQLRPIILYGEKGIHPYQQAINYCQTKGFAVKEWELLPGLLLNRFDSEPNEDYLVLSFRVTVTREREWKWIADDMNTSANWMVFESFVNSEKLLPELKDKLFVNLLKGKPLHYSGFYRESDGSNEVIEKVIHNKID